MLLNFEFSINQKLQIFKTPVSISTWDNIIVVANQFVLTNDNNINYQAELKFFYHNNDYILKEFLYNTPII